MATATMGITNINKLGNIEEYQRQVIEAVVNNEFATIDLRKCRNVFAEEPFLLDDDFVAQYIGKEPDWGELGWFTFKRTYARRVERPDGTSVRTEDWTETVRRVVEGNLNLIKNDPVVTQEYAQKMFDLIWNLVWTPPGRGLWISGTEFAKRTGDAFNNCWAVAIYPYHYGETNKIFTRWEIDPQKKYVSYPFVFLFDQLMKGGGVGFSAERKFIDLIPPVAQKVNLIIEISVHNKDYKRVIEEAKKVGYRKYIQTKSFGNDLVNEYFRRDAYRLRVADSREGWCEALAVVIDLHFEKRSKRPITLIIDVDEIRPYGEPIRGFGGVASGCYPLIELLIFINKRLNELYGKKLRSVDCVDFCNAIGRAVVAGNVRRSAEIAIGNADDLDFINMKNYTLTADAIKGWDGTVPKLRSVFELMLKGYSRKEAKELRYAAWAQRRFRWASNNSVAVDDPENYDFGIISPSIEANGEPGFLNRWLMKNFGRIIDGFHEGIDKDAELANPCAEISLASGEPCNLAELMLPVMYKKGYKPEEVLPFMVHYTKRITFSNYDWERSREIISKNRRIGISLSGIMDWILMKYGRSAIVGWKKYKKEDWHDMVWLYNDRPYALINSPAEITVKTEYNEENGETIRYVKVVNHYDPETEVVEPIYNPELVMELDRMYKIVKRADIEYSHLLSKALGYEVKPSIKVTTVKPSGTVSLLAGISPGVHAHYFRYGIRRVRVQQDDPLLKLSQFCGYRTEPAIGSPNAWVIEFPVKAPTADHPDFRSQGEMTIEEQFAMQALLCIYWADNMVSCTITFHNPEKPKIKHLLTQYRKRIKSTSLLPYSGHGYAQAPYEPLTKEEYEERVKEIKWKPHEAYRLLMNTGQFEDREMTLEEALECASGHCPVR